MAHWENLTGGATITDLQFVREKTASTKLHLNAGNLGVS